MKTILCLVAFLIGLSTIDADIPFSSIIARMNIDFILKDETQRSNAISCLLDGNNCGPYAVIINRVLPTIIKSQCEECSEKQKTDAVKFLKYLQTDPENWKKFLKKYNLTDEKIVEFMEQSTKESQ